MKVISKLNQSDEAWDIGDVIEFGNNASCTLRHAMIIRRKSQIFDGAATFSTVLLDGPRISAASLIDEIFDTWKHVKKVNFQGVDEGRIF